VIHRVLASLLTRSRWSAAPSFIRKRAGRTEQELRAQLVHVGWHPLIVISALWSLSGGK
jgi:hypothetical protein